MKSKSISAFWIAIGNFISFAFAIISSSILSRYLNKGDYGTYRQVIYVYTTLLVVFSVGLPKAFSHFLPRVEFNMKRDVIKKITNLFLLLGFIFSLVLFLGSHYIAVLLKNPDLESSLKIFSVVPLLTLPTLGIEGIYASLQKTQLVAFYSISTRVLMLICTCIPVIFYNGNHESAVIGFSISALLSFFIALFFKWNPFKDLLNIKSNISYLEILKFSTPLMFASLSGILISAADQFFISRFFGNEIFAEFSNGSIQLPLVPMITGASAAVLQPIFSKMIFDGIDKSEIVSIWRSTLIKSAMLIYPLVIYFWMNGTEVMTLLYGNQYHNSGIYFRIMILVNFFNIIIFAPLMFALNATKVYAYIHFFIAILIWILQFISVKTFSSPILITCISVLCRIGLIISMSVFLLKSLKLKSSELFPIGELIKIFIIAGISLTVTSFLLNQLNLLSSFIRLLVSALIYFPFLILLSSQVGIQYLTLIIPFIHRLKFKLKNK